MVFSSLFFVFFFLALNLIAYHFADGIKRKNMVLLGFSLVFYAWGGPKYLLLLLSMVFASWIFALLIDQYRESGRSKLFLICDCVFMLGLLCIFKYLTFFSSITNTIFHFPKEIPQIALPIGISFYTFQLLSYVIDVYREEVEPQRKFVNLLLYASLFHQCIAGPIVRYQLVADEIENRKVKMDELYKGIKRFTIGLAKKAILANGCATVADTLVPTLASDIAEIPAAGLWIGMLFYALQIYLIFPPIPTWQSVWDLWLVFTTMKTLITLTSPVPSKNSGTDGIFPSELSSVIMSIFHSAETGKVPADVPSTF